MVKQYLRYVSKDTFGVVSSFGSNAIYGGDGKVAILPALHEIKLWDMKKGLTVGTLTDPDIKSEVSQLCLSSDGINLAAGYSDGTVRVWDLPALSLKVVFNGHKSHVTALGFDYTGTMLVSGSKDTDVIVWDLVNEAGLYRLKGHRNQVNGCQFLGTKNYLLTISKDTLIKVWDLTTQHCLQTLIGARSELTSFAFDDQEGYLFTGSADPEVKLWKVEMDKLDRNLMDDDVDPNDMKVVRPVGDVERTTKGRVMQIQLCSEARIVSFQGQEKALEFHRFRTIDEVKKKITRRLRRLKEKGKLPTDAQLPTTAAAILESDIQAADLLDHCHTLRTDTKIRSFSLHPSTLPHSLKLLVALTDNCAEEYALPLPDKTKTSEDLIPSIKHSLELPGHRTDIRAVSLSSDDELLASVAGTGLKVWNIRTGSCIRTMECGQAVCCRFLPGDRHIAVGTKSGALELFDVASSTMIESFPIHESTLWSIDVCPDKSGLVTGSADKDVKFFDFDTKTTVEEDGTGHVTRQLTLTLTRTLQMADDILCVRFSTDQKLLAISLIDATVKVLYTDSLKIFLSLYGHKLPVTSMDISTDNKLIVTGSGDKNIKLWGLDFGDCHRSFFAHQEPITQVKFVQDTHYFFSASRDRCLKYWDGDKFENVMKLDGHLGEIWAMDISNYGTFVITAGADRSIRTWERTEEPLFLEEEKEKQLEELFEASLVKDQAEEPVEGEEGKDEVGKATHQTMMSLKAGERLMEALELADAQRKDFEAYEEAQLKGQPSIPPPIHPILQALNLSPERYVLNTLQKIKTTDLDDALLVLPFSHATSLLHYINLWTQNKWAVQLCTKVMVYIVKLHFNQIVAGRGGKKLLESIRTELRNGLQQDKDRLGYNIAGLKFVSKVHRSNNATEFLDDTEAVQEEVAKKVKRKVIA